MANKPTHEELEQRIQELENETFEHKRAEEERELTLSQLRATLEATVDGIIVVGLDSETKVFSKRFRKIWHMPDSVLDSKDANQVLDYVLDQINESEVFSQKVQAVFADPNSNTFDTLHLKDGRILEVYSRPQKLEDKMIGRVWAFRDVTKTKQAIMEQQKAQSRLQALSDASFEAIFFSDQGVCMDQNSAAERMFGYSHKEAIGRNGTEWIVPEDREKVKNNMLVGYEKPYEVTGLRKDGSTFPAEIQGHMLNFLGKSTRVTALRDNSVQQQAREALRESEDKYRTYIEQANDGISVVHKGKLTFVNSRLAEIMGFKVDELEGKGFLQFIPKGKLIQITDNLKRRLAGEEVPQVYESRILHKDSSEIDVEFNITTIVSNDEPATLAIIRDITERKQAEVALQKSEEKFRTLFDTSPHAIALTEMKTGKIVDVNDKFCQLTEYKKNEVIGRSTTQLGFYSEDDRNRFVDELTDSGKVHGLEMDFRAKHGSIIDAHMFAVPIQFEGEALVLTEFYDVTEQKRTKEALLESEEKFRSLAENQHDVVWTVNENLEVDYISPSCFKMTGTTAEETIGKNPKEFYTEESYQRVIMKLAEERQKSANEMQPGVLEVEQYHEDGHLFPVEITCMPVIIDNKVVGVQGITRDITERKNAEKALRESEEKYRTILETMEEGYYEVDLAGNYTFVNDTMCRIRGYSREDLIGMNNRGYMSEETAKKVFKAFNSVYTSGNSSKNLQWETIRKDGAKIQIETSASLIRDSEGKPIGFRGIVRDISEKQRLEAQLRHAQRMESIGTLAGGIAHNFNNLLMGIQGNASMMLLDLDSGNPRHKNLTNIEKLVKNGAKLTAQLIGYAREGSYEVRPTSLNQLVKETSDTFGMTKKEITVHQELSEKLYDTNVDQGQIEQVLLNLYVNATDAMPGGGDLFLKTINVTDKDITSKPYKVQPGNYILLTVRDTGVGMDKETRERIFEPFFTTKGLASGTGLGMASAYGIIEGHGGYIDVDSEVGEGATFSIYLPATEKVIEEKKVLSDELVKGKGTVLLVDDEKMFLEVGEELLTHLGYEVLLAENGREALELYKKNQDKIDLVLLDMVMPVMGGGETFDRMKEINTNVKVLLSSGYSIEGEAKEILERGCDAFIQKPFKMEQLSQKLREILDKK